MAATLRAVLAFPAIRVIDADLMQRAIEVYDLLRLDFADAYLVASAERTGNDVAVRQCLLPHSSLHSARS